VQVTSVSVRGILTRSSGFLRTVCSHSLQPFRGCSYGRALCGVGCYAQHNRWLARGETWGSFLEARVNAAEVYLAQHAAEARWGRRARGAFTIFMSSSTDPFVPQEERLGITAGVLRAMLERPPDGLIVQTHSDRVLLARDALVALAQRCELRVHLSIESDRDRLPGLPPPACSVEARLAAAAALRAAGLRTVITVAPLLPIARPEEFFERLGAVADAVVIDHFIEGDGTPDGGRTQRTALPAAMAAVEPGSVSLEYRERMVAIARRLLPGRVGVSVDGFAGRMLEE
jgi:DNA repair photolyase